MRIAICDDEIVQLEYLTQLIGKIGQKTKVEHAVKTFQSAEQLLFEFPEEMPFDLLVLDIMMNQMNGMELAKKIRNRDKNIRILFLTGTPELVFEG